MFQCLENFDIRHDDEKVIHFVKGSCYLIDVFKPVREGDVGVVEVGGTNTLLMPVNTLKTHFRRCE